MKKTYISPATEVLTLGAENGMMAINSVDAFTNENADDSAVLGREDIDFGDEAWGDFE